MNEESKLKIWRIARALRDRTRTGDVEWEETDVRGRFAAVLGEGSFVFDKDEADYRIYVQDSDGFVIEQWRVGPAQILIGGRDYTPDGEEESLVAILRELYEVVRRRVWGVDSTLDAVLRELDG